MQQHARVFIVKAAKGDEENRARKKGGIFSPRPFRLMSQLGTRRSQNVVQVSFLGQGALVFLSSYLSFAMWWDI